MTNQQKQKGFNIGDKVYHRSDSSIIWVIEKIEKDEAYCSTVIKETAELKKEKFALITLAKINESGNGSFIFGIYDNEKKNRNRW